jgi:hypothetical protein
MTSSKQSLYFPTAKEYLRSILKSGVMEAHDMTKKEKILIDRTFLMMHQGKGVYVTNCFESALDILRRDLNHITHGLIVVIDFDELHLHHNLRMDELDMTKHLTDKEVYPEFRAYYPHIADRFESLASVMELDINQLQELKINLIDTYKLKPDGRLPGYENGFRGLTARYPFDIPRENISSIYEYDPEFESVHHIPGI